MKTYHGWIIVIREKGFTDVIFVEYFEEDGSRHRRKMEARGNFGAAEAVEWWDKKLGAPGRTKLEPILSGQYRVYTENNDGE